MTCTRSARRRPDPEPRCLQLLVQLPVPPSRPLLPSRPLCSGHPESRTLSLSLHALREDSGVRRLFSRGCEWPRCPVLSAALEAGDQVRVATCAWGLSPRGRAGCNQPRCLLWSVTNLAPATSPSRPQWQAHAAPQHCHVEAGVTEGPRRGARVPRLVSDGATGARAGAVARPGSHSDGQRSHMRSPVRPALNRYLKKKKMIKRNFQLC